MERGGESFICLLTFPPHTRQQTLIGLLNLSLSPSLRRVFPTNCSEYNNSYKATLNGRRIASRLHLWVGVIESAKRSKKDGCIGETRIRTLDLVHEEILRYCGKSADA
jgi:hypothetical protein